MRRTALAAALALLLAGCGTSAAVDAVPVERPTTAAATPTPATPRIGGKQASAAAESSVDVTVLRLRLPFTTTPPGLLERERKGYEYAAIEVKVCVTRNSSGLPLGVTWSPWSLAYESGVVVQAASSYSDEWFSEPLYPQDHIVKTGRCVRGWIPFEVRKGDGRPELVGYAPSEGPALEWAVAGPA